MCGGEELSNMLMSKGIPGARANGAGMSAIGGIVRTPSPDEIAAGGNVVPLRHGSPPVESDRRRQLRRSDLSARSSRWSTPSSRASSPGAAAGSTSAGPSSQALPGRADAAASSSRFRSSQPAPRRRRIRLGLLTSAAGVIALGVLLTLVVGREEQPVRRAQQTQSVAAAVSPTKATVTQPGTTSQTARRPRLPSLPAPRRRRRRPRPFTRSQFRGRRLSGSLPRMQRRTSSSCSRAASASSERAWTKPDSSFPVVGGKRDARTPCCPGVTAGTCGRSPSAPIASRPSRR